MTRTAIAPRPKGQMTPKERAARLADAQQQFMATRTLITDALHLDDLEFMVDEQQRSEIATCQGGPVGDVLLDDNAEWFARKLDGKWRPMRSAAEARAFIVSKIRQ